MTLRRLPVFPTLLVLAAAGVMVWLGFWQLRRLAEKEALLARYEAGHVMAAEIAWPGADAKAVQLALYRRSRLTCTRVLSERSIAGRSAKGEAGLGVYVTCATPDGTAATVVLGWTRDPAQHGDWSGGEVRGTIAPGPRLVADPPLGGLAANEAPDPSEIPNNHLAYAVQWFLFAATALVIYAVALWRRMKP